MNSLVHVKKKGKKCLSQLKEGKHSLIAAAKIFRKLCKMTGHVQPEGSISESKMLQYLNLKFETVCSPKCAPELLKPL